MYRHTIDIDIDMAIAIDLDTNTDVDIDMQSHVYTHHHLSSVQNPSHIPLYWLVCRDSSIGFL